MPDLFPIESTPAPALESARRELRRLEDHLADCVTEADRKHAEFEINIACAAIRNLEAKSLGLPTDLQEVAKWKNRFGIQTHYSGPSPFGEPWVAVSMPECSRILSGYDLTEEEKTDIAALFAGYCRLIDDANLAHYGATEHEACKSLVARLEAAEPEAGR